jgi:STE24 endopeptidase
MIRRMKALIRAVLVCMALAFGAAPAAKGEPALLSPEHDNGWRETAKERTSRALVLYFGEQVATIAFLAWLAFSGAAVSLRERLRKTISRPILLQMAYLTLLLALLLCVSFPFDAGRYALSKFYGVSRQELVPWLGDYALAFAVNAVLAVTIGLGFYRLLDRRPRTWWRWVAAAAVPFAVVAAAAAPVYMSLFNTFTPLQDRALADRILEVAARGGIPAEEVHVVDMSRQSNAANAFVAGIGPTAVVGLGDTLLDRFSEQEIVFVMAHEMGHYVHRHVWIGVVLGALGALMGAFLLQRLLRLLLSRYHERLRVDDVADVASAPSVLLVVMLMAAAAQPAACAVSRAIETQADRFALQLTVPGDASPEAAVSAFERLGRSALSDPSPNPVVKWLLWTHPTIDERQEAVRAWALSR